MIRRWFPFVHCAGVEARRRRKPFPLEMLLQEVEDARGYCRKAWGRYCPSQGRLLERLGAVAWDLSKACNITSLDVGGLSSESLLFSALNR